MLTLIIANCTALCSVHIGRGNEIDVSQLKYCCHYSEDVHDFRLSHTQVFHRSLQEHINYTSDKVML